MTLTEEYPAHFKMSMLSEAMRNAAKLGVRDDRDASGFQGAHECEYIHIYVCVCCTSRSCSSPHPVQAAVLLFEQKAVCTCGDSLPGIHCPQKTMLPLCHVLLGSKRATTQGLTPHLAPGFVACRQQEWDDGH